MTSNVDKVLFQRHMEISEKILNPEMEERENDCVMETVAILKKYACDLLK